MSLMPAFLKRWYFHCRPTSCLTGSHPCGPHFVYNVMLCSSSLQCVPPEWLPRKGATYKEGTRESMLVSLPMCVASIFTLSIPSVLRPDVWDMPEASTLVGYLNGGCPWCVHFIYDEYYMANLLSVPNSSWENFTRGNFSRRLPRVRKQMIHPMISA